MRTEEQIKREVGLLKDVPMLIQLAAQVYDNLPKNHKGRVAIVKQIDKLRSDLIRLDVVCQDLEWAILQSEVREKYKDDD
tara:strand:- start:10 stop:249 length:240 start_codon:yes stop_codon:yes gene_type:complete